MTHAQILALLDRVDTSIAYHDTRRALVERAALRERAERIAGVLLGAAKRCKGTPIPARDHLAAVATTVPASRRAA